MQKHPTNPAKKSRQGADSGAITISKLRENDPIQEGPVDDNQANKTAEEIVQNLALNDDDRHHAEGLSDNMHPFKSNCKCYTTTAIFIILDLFILTNCANFVKYRTTSESPRTMWMTFHLDSPKNQKVKMAKAMSLSP